MDDRYEAFCMAHPLFYDTLHLADRAAPRTAGADAAEGSGRTGTGNRFMVLDRPLPDGWRREEQDDWWVFVPEALDVPKQGWKIHISACLDNAERILETVWSYCIERDIEFKFLRSRAVLWLRSSKYAPRGYSGKLVTVYPSDEAACERMLTELGALLDGEPGPYILSDVRWGTGPLFVRYGGFSSRYTVSDRGQVVLAIEDDAGNLVPDRRDPVFHVPPWVTVPNFLQPHVDARSAVTVADLPFTFEQVMHFSNGGGLYRGRDKRTDAEVVLKEARPHAGLDSLGLDAVARLDREHDTLRRLAGIPAVPKVYDRFTVGEHHFLAMEYIDGRPLRAALVRKYPMIDVSATSQDFADYTDWAVDVYRQVEETVHAMHERGVVYGDLHLFNIMVRDDDSIVLLDFETSSLVSENTRPGLGNQGFAPPPGTTGPDVDLYALACLRLSLFMPMTQLLWLSRAKAVHMAEVIAEHFPVPPEFLAAAVGRIVPPDGPAPRPLRMEPTARAWPDIRRQLTTAILATATPDRDDRLFPGDIEQFRLGGLGLAYGAAGVLHTLATVAGERHPRLEEWLLDRAVQPPHGTLLGLYDGLHGVAFALEELGHRDAALQALQMCLDDDWERMGLDLIGGLPGIGLSLAYFGDRTGDPRLDEALRRCAELVMDRLGDVDSVAETSGRPHPHAGLFRGSSGPAVFLTRMYERTGDLALLDAAAVALRQDLRRCIVRDSGAMEVNEGWRTMPYLATGSVGVGFALDEYLEYRHDEQFVTASAAIHRAATSRLYVQSGLFAGRAGILHYLAGRTERPLADPQVAAHVGRLAWHALPYADGIAFPGDQLLRLSMDVATGTAGVLLALGAAFGDKPVHLPLLASSAQLRAAHPQTPASSRRGLASITS